MNWRAFTLLIVLSGIDAARSLTERKERVMLARQCGFLDDQETEEWIVLGGMVEA